MELNDCYTRKVNSKAFAIPILTARLFRIGIANALELTFLV